MRPLFAIAPLAAVLVLVGPTPHEANVTLAKMWARLLPADTATQQAQDIAAPTQAAAKPAMRHGSPAFTSAQYSRTSFEAGLTR
jgi:hypothetical protein